MTDTKSAPTPGPWYAITNGMDAQVRCPDGRSFVIGDAVYHQENKANAHLIAAAPELYAVLTRLVGYCSRPDGTLADYADWMQTFLEDGSTLTDVVERAVAAIAKAEGR